MDQFIALLIGTTSGVAAAVITSWLSFRENLWQHRRHDYAQLLIAFSKRDPEEILKRIELTALVGSRRVREKALSIKDELIDDTKDLVSEKAAKEWRSAIFNLMKSDV